MCLVGKEAEDSELQEAAEIHEIPVVREEWVLYSIQCQQRLPLSCFQAPFGDDNAGQVFGHLNICLGGLTIKDRQSLWALIISKGGNVTYELNKNTTHLVVGAASGPKYFEALKRNGAGHNVNTSDDSSKEDIIKIVTPDWIMESIQKKQKLIERPFHPRLMTLPGQPIQTRPRRPKHRLKPRQVQLPVGPTKHTTQSSSAMSKTPSNQLLLKQLQGDKTPASSTSQSKLASTVSTKTSLPPPPTLPSTRVSLNSTPSTPIQAKKSAPIPVTGANDSTNPQSIKSTEKLEATSVVAAITTSITHGASSTSTDSTLIGNNALKSQTSSSDQNSKSDTPMPVSTNTITVSAITAVKSQAVTVTSVSDGGINEAATPASVTTKATVGNVASINPPITSADASTSNVSVTTSTIAAPASSQNTTAFVNTPTLAGPRPTIPSSPASIRLPQTPVSMSTAQMLAGQRPVPPSSITATSNSITPQSSTLTQNASSNVTVSTSSNPAVLQQQQQLPTQPLQVSQQSTISLPQQPVMDSANQQPNLQTTNANVQGQTVGNQNQVIPQNTPNQLMQPQQIQQSSATGQPGQPGHPTNMQQMQPGQPIQQGQGPNQQWNQQQWQGNQGNSFPQQPQQQWSQGQPMPPGQMNQQMRPRQVTPQMVQQQQIIQRHIASLTLEQRNQFQQMPTREKQMYLHARGLLLSPQTRQMLALTEEQKQMLQTMDPQQKAAFIEKLRKDAQMRQMMLQRQQMAQQQGQAGNQVQNNQQVVGGPNSNNPQQMQTWPAAGQGNLPQQFGQNVRGPSHTSPQPMQAQQQISPSGSVTPPNARMPIPGSMQMPGQNRPQWSGETHPALAQVPRTPQQLQHLQRLALQREQQLEQQQMLPHQRPQTPVSMSPLGSVGTSGQQSPVNPQISGPPQSPQVPQSPQGINQIPQPFNQQSSQIGQPISTMAQGAVGIGQPSQVGANANPNQKTKAALASMINNRLQQPQTPNMATGAMPLQQQAMPAAPPPQIPPQMSPQNVSGGSPSMDVSATNRLQMMNQQLQHLPNQTPPPGASIIGAQTSMVGQPSMFAQQQRQPLSPHQQQSYLAMSQQRRALEAMGQRGPIPSGSPVSPHSMGQRFMGPRGPMQPPHVRPGIPGMAPMPPRQPIFYGHDPNSVGKLPSEYCLLGCIFHIIDYQEDPDESKYVRDWKKVIRQFGGEVEDAYHPRITHLMCKKQDSSVSTQALREGKRLITVYWLNDIVVLRKVVPPWKGVHFPLPSNFDEPCKHMILTLTGFEGRDRDWVKDMIKLSGAKYTSYFTRHNHAIICKTADGEKYTKAKEWKVPTVSVQWLNEVLFGNVNGAQVMNNPKFQNFKEDPFKMEYALVPNLIAAWKNPIGVTRETWQKFKSNPPRSKRKAENTKLEEEEAKRLKLQEEQNKNTDETQTKSNENEVKVENGDTHSKENSAQNGAVQSNGHNEKEVADENENKIKTEIGPLNEHNKPRILFTGFVPSSLSEMERMARELGAKILTCQNSSEATHMVMPKLGRTMAFLCGLSYTKYIVSSTWIEESSAAKQFLGTFIFSTKTGMIEISHKIVNLYKPFKCTLNLRLFSDENPYALEDEAFDNKFGCDIRKTLNRKGREKLFEVS